MTEVLLLLTWSFTVVLYVLAFRRDRIAGIAALPALASMSLSVVVVAVGDSLAAASIGGPAAQVWFGVNLDSAALSFSTTALAAVATVLAASLVLGRSTLRTANATSVQISPRIAAVSVFAAFAMSVAADVVYGVGNLVSRSNYDPPRAIPALSALAGVLIPIGFALAVLVLVASSGRFIRLMAACVILLQLASLYAMSSRQLALLPLIALALVLLLGRRLTPRVIVILGGASVVFLAVAVALRNLSGGHGFVPYSAYLLGGGGVDLSSSLWTLAGNVAFAVPLTSYVASTGVFNTNDLALSLSISPSSDAEWAIRSRDLRVHDFIPFNATGEIATIGWLLLASLVCGATLAVYVVLRRLSANGRPLLLQAVAILYLFSFVLSLQYNTRSVSRFAYLIPVLLVGAWILGLVLPRVRRDRKSPEHKNHNRGRHSHSSAHREHPPRGVSSKRRVAHAEDDELTSDSKPGARFKTVYGSDADHGRKSEARNRREDRKPLASVRKQQNRSGPVQYGWKPGESKHGYGSERS
ncbi:hypothetical protein QQX10_08510 [Demequina sp. SYSU T00039]|uniref:Oligosaccharide repeat unit polymerase n=1 Tax=Demequina lignilytica TaxID=3051663 RepID=A0AAW7M5J5_9MICO|nr:MULTISPECIES: hypothetical protein [unclassified Demequina]MDN4477442.1 hypothetical protein [Demequina sp. SYSU T00039-1]MDN4488207.1 hypothetical protein [Demequina sp. SYSU T00039]